MKNLQTFDILLCSGTGSLSKKIIWFNKITGVKGEAAQVSHIALYCDGQVFESTSLNKWADNKAGVQINPYSKWLDNYQGRVCVRRLEFPRTYEFEKKCMKFVIDNLGKPYENGIAGYGELLLAGLQLDEYIRKIWKSYRPLATKNPHCSEICMEALQNMALCKKTAIPSRLPPSCWWQGGDIEKYLKVPIYKPDPLK
jgi:hypothetical protein